MAITMFDSDSSKSREVGLSRLDRFAIGLPIVVCSLAVFLSSARLPCSAQDAIDIRGTWHSTAGFVYNIVQEPASSKQQVPIHEQEVQGIGFTWTVEGYEEEGRGTIVTEPDMQGLYVEWSGNISSGSATGFLSDASVTLGSDGQPEFIFLQHRGILERLLPPNVLFRNRLSTDKDYYTSGEPIRIFFETPIDAEGWYFRTLPLGSLNSDGERILYMVLDSNGERVLTGCLADIDPMDVIEPGQRYSWLWDQVQVLCGQDGFEQEDSFLVSPGTYTVIVEVVVQVGLSEQEILKHSAAFEIRQATPSISLSWRSGLINQERDRDVDVGDEISYAITVTNTGNVTLTNVTLSSRQAEVRGGPITSLAPGASDSVTFTATHTLTQADMDDGRFSSTATVTAAPPNGRSVAADDTDTRRLPTAPAVSMTYAGTLDMSVIPPADRADVGDEIRYAVTVTNLGNVTLTNVTLSAPNVTVRGGPIASLAPGALDSTTFTGTYTLTQADIDDGRFASSATLTATSPNGRNVADNDTDMRPLSTAPAVSMTCAGTLDMSVVPPADRADVGDEISYAITVNNMGNATLTNITLNAANVTVRGGPIASLAPGASDSVTFTATHSLTQADVDAGAFTSTATVTATPPNGRNVSDNDTDTHRLPHHSPTHVSVWVWVVAGLGGMAGVVGGGVSMRQLGKQRFRRKCQRENATENEPDKTCTPGDIHCQRKNLKLDPKPWTIVKLTAPPAEGDEKLEAPTLVKRKLNAALVAARRKTSKDDLQRQLESAAGVLIRWVAQSFDSSSQDIVFTALLDCGKIECNFVLSKCQGVAGASGWQPIDEWKATLKAEREEPVAEIKQVEEEMPTEAEQRRRELASALAEFAQRVSKLRLRLRDAKVELERED